MNDWNPEVCKACLNGQDSIFRAKAEVARLARLMTKSDRAEAKYRPALDKAKANLRDATVTHEMHLASCEGLQEAPHGSYSRYTSGHCRCDQCRDAQHAYYLATKGTA